jgi:mono/diheme cytochrome c family protein
MRLRVKLGLLAAALLFVCSGAQAQSFSFGERIFQQKADCKYCHGSTGDGHGDPRSPGVPANLAQTRLNKEQLMSVIACGRPATQMPYFDRYAYEDGHCQGLSAADLGGDMPPRPTSNFLTAREIAEVTDYILGAIVEK